MMKLNPNSPTDKAIRPCFPLGPNTDGLRLTIEYRSGFEMFNTRPYHNYETWGAGWFITDGTVKVQAEDFDDAIAEFVRAHRNPRWKDFAKPEDRKAAHERAIAEKKQSDTAPGDEP